MSGFWTRGGRLRRLVPALLVAVLSVAGCSEISDRVDAEINEAASSALESAISDRLAQNGIELESGPDCSSDVNRDGAALTGSSTCDGTTVEGREATAVFDGTLSDSGCTGSLHVEVDGKTVVDRADIPDCSVNL